jgi:xanthine dehydrogenase molybdopterin-binding subunit B
MSHLFIVTILQGKQHYTVDSTQAPINAPIVHLSAEKQVSGEAIYTDDIPHQPKELQVPDSPVINAIRCRLVHLP